MISFPYCKINIGLDIIRKRADGYHDINTLMIPVRGLCDSLEIVQSNGSGAEFSQSGIIADCNPEQNLCVKAYELMRAEYGIGGVLMHLHKAVPFGAGLGGGSSDAAFAIKGLNDLFSLGIDDGRMEQLAAKLGSDTAFFIKGKPALARGRGEVLTPMDMNVLEGMHIVIVKPDINISTAEAYSNVKPHIPQTTLAEHLNSDISLWRDCIGNDFERGIFSLYPRLSDIKEWLYDQGAVYASMSGSGSSLFGLFRSEPQLQPIAAELFIHQSVISFRGDY